LSKAGKNKGPERYRDDIEAQTPDDLAEAERWEHEEQQVSGQQYSLGSS